MYFERKSLVIETRLEVSIFMRENDLDKIEEIDKIDKIGNYG